MQENEQKKLCYHLRANRITLTETDEVIKGNDEVIDSVQAKEHTEENLSYNVEEENEDAMATLKPL